MHVPDRSTAPAFQITGNTALYEPWIDLIRRQLERLLSLVELEQDGRPVTVDSFRLRNLADWLVPASVDPVAVIASAGSHCDLDCVFCYNKGNPPSLALRSPERSAARELHETITCLRYTSHQRPDAACSRPLAVATKCCCSLVSSKFFGNCARRPRQSSESPPTAGC